MYNTPYGGYIREIPMGLITPHPPHDVIRFHWQIISKNKSWGNQLQERVQTIMTKKQQTNYIKWIDAGDVFRWNTSQNL